MTTYTDFVPSNVAPFTFQPELDGTIYTVAVTWNLFGRRYYVSCYDLSGNLVFAVPLIGSPSGHVLQSISWAVGVATATCVDPHGYVPGSTISLTVDGSTPGGYDGTFDALIVDGSTFTYSLMTNPGPLVSAGNASRNISLSAGYFASTLVYRAPNGQFEVSP